MAAISSGLNVYLKAGMRGVPSVMKTLDHFLVAAGGVLVEFGAVHPAHQCRTGVADAAMLFVEPAAELLGRAQGVIVVLGKGRRAGGEQQQGDHRATLHFETPSSPYVLSKQRLAL